MDGGVFLCPLFGVQIMAGWVARNSNAAGLRRRAQRKKSPQPSITGTGSGAK